MFQGQGLKFSKSLLCSHEGAEEPGRLGLGREEMSQGCGGHGGISDLEVISGSFEQTLNRLLLL